MYPQVIFKTSSPHLTMDTSATPCRPCVGGEAQGESLCPQRAPLVPRTEAMILVMFCGGDTKRCTHKLHM